MSVELHDLNVGDTLPEFHVPLTRTLIVATAIASRDYQDVHHDPGLAQERGSQDIFMNILTSNGFAERYIRDWAGRKALIKRIKLRLGAPNYPGDIMVCRGEVTEIDVEYRRVVVAVTMSNQLGNHAGGQVEVVLPA